MPGITENILGVSWKALWDFPSQNILTEEWGLLLLQKAFQENEKVCPGGSIDLGI